MADNNMYEMKSRVNIDLRIIWRLRMRWQIFTSRQLHHIEIYSWYIFREINIFTYIIHKFDAT